MLNQNAKLLTASETAELLSVDVGTLAVWRCKKQYKDLKYLKIGNRIRYRYKDVLEFVESNLRH